MTTLLDTRVVPGPDRPDYWAAGIAEHFFPIRVESFGTRSFDARLAGGQVGPLAVRSISGLPHRVSRTQRMIAAADPECILLYLPRSGTCRIEQDECISVLRPGDIAIQDTSRPSTFEAMTGVDFLVLSFPKWLIGQKADAIGRRASTRLAGREEPFARLVAPFVAGLASAADGSCISGPEGDGAAEMLLTMLRTLYGEDDTQTSRGEVLLSRMCEYIRAHLRDPDLGPERLARAHFVSTRYVYKLFSVGGISVGAWIRQERLEHALVQLRESPGLTIAQIAANWGYRDPASFSRAFREQFGQTPREARVA